MALVSKWALLTETRALRLDAALSFLVLVAKSERLLRLLGAWDPLPTGPLVGPRGHPTIVAVLRAKRGDPEAREVIARGCMSILRRAARHFNASDADDLVQEGAIGLMRAIDKWSPTGGANFNTYATYWVRAYTLRGRKNANRRAEYERPFLESESGDVVEPGDDGRGAASIERASLAAAISSRLADLGGALGRDVELIQRHTSGASLEDIGTELGVSRERARQLLRRSKERVAAHLQDLK